MLLISVSWFLGLRPWHWMTTGKCCQGSGLSNHHPRDSHKGRSCQMERKGLFFYSSMFPSSPSLSLLLFFCVGPLLPSLCFYIFHSPSKKDIHILSFSRFELSLSPLVLTGFFLQLSGHHYLLFPLSLSFRPSCPPLPCSPPTTSPSPPLHPLLSIFLLLLFFFSFSFAQLASSHCWYQKQESLHFDANNIPRI